MAKASHMILFFLLCYIK